MSIAADELRAAMVGLVRIALTIPPEHRDPGASATEAAIKWKQ